MSERPWSCDSLAFRSVALNPRHPQLSLKLLQEIYYFLQTRYQHFSLIPPDVLSLLQAGNRLLL